MILGGGLLVLGFFATTFHRDQWPGLMGDEATYLMQAESLAFDLDFQFQKEDYTRFEELHGMAPEGLILQKHPTRPSFIFGKPFFYALWAAPWVRLFPIHGIFMANLLALAIGALTAAAGLRHRLGEQAPLWIALFLFGSVTFAWVFWAHPDLFLMSATATALGLALGRPEKSRAVDRPLRWIVAGLLLSMVIYSRPLYGPLLLPLLFTTRWFSGFRFRWLLVGLLGFAALSAGLQYGMSGEFSSYRGARRGFYSYTGYPLVDFSAEDWQSHVEKDADWHGGVPDTDLSIWGWNSIFFLSGRNVGLLPYFLPLFLAVACLGFRRKSDFFLLPAALLTILAFLYLRPFNFWGGGGSLANRYFLPLYPLFWFLPTPVKSAKKLGITLLLAAPFLYPLWLGAARWPHENGVPRYVSPVAQRVLPFESTQLHLKPSGRDDVVHQGLWLKVLDPHLKAQSDYLEFTDNRKARFIVGSAVPLHYLELRSEGAPPRRLDMESVHSRHHPMWWSSEKFHLYFITLDPGEKSNSRFRLKKVERPTED